MTLRHIRHNIFILLCPILLLIFACLFSVTTVSASPLLTVNDESKIAAMPSNPDTVLPDSVSSSIPDDAVAVSKDLVVTPGGTIKDLTTGKTVIDQLQVGTKKTQPDPLAKTGGEKFVPVPVDKIKKTMRDHGTIPPNTARTNSAAGFAPVSTITYRTLVSAEALTSTTINSGVAFASFPNSRYGAYWGDYKGSPAFYESGGTLFAQQAQGVVDVSEWQGGNIDWAKAKAAGLKGAIIRLGYGWGNGFDKQAQRNIRECKRLGIPFGVYWYSYAENSGNAASEGADTVSLLRQAGVNPGDMSYPVFYDLEQWAWTGHTPPKNPNMYNAIINAWYARLQSAGYKNLSVYSYADYLETALNSAAIHAKTRWVASYGPRTEFSFVTNDRGWQYTSSGNFSGFTGNVDLNAFGVLHDSGMAPVYRVYNRNSGLHHYTTNPNEYRTLVSMGWRDEGTAFQAVAQGTVGATAVYREYNPNNGNHNWTRNRHEHDVLVSLGWRDEGTAWWVPADGAKGVVDVYRLYNPYSGEHVYTASTIEYAKVVKAGWHQEGVAWKAYPNA